MKKMVNDLFDETVRRFPNQDLSGFITQYREDWHVVAGQNGWELFEVAVKRARMGSFFPVPNEVMDNIPVPNERAVFRYRDQCGKCWGLGWKNVGPDRPSQGNRNPREDRFMRCDCASVQYEQRPT